MTSLDPARLEGLRGALLELLNEVWSDGGRSLRFKARGVSMWPFIREGDEVTIQRIELGALAVGDIAALHAPGNLLVTHRIIAIKRPSAGRIFVEKGDNNMALSTVGDQRMLGQVVSIRFHMGRQVDLTARRWRWLGLIIAYHGRVAIRVFAWLRYRKRALVGEGSGRLLTWARGATTAGLQLPSRLLLSAARAIMP